MQRVIGVKLKTESKASYFLPPKFAVEVGNLVMVESGDGLELGEVAFLSKEVAVNPEENPLRKVVRVASKEDVKRYDEDQKKVPEITKQIEKKIKELNLDMKIVGVFVVNNGNKILVEFISENRVDFRELLKQLASSLKARIELKQIGQRDEVKEKGGLGPCGQVCCCNQYLKDFEHVSIKMAKNQGLALNPSKISGLCGKLLCCLAYENNFYVEAMKTMPKINQEVEVPNGKGKVVYNDILRGFVTVRMIDKDEGSQVVVPLENVKFNKQNKEEQNAPEHEKKVFKKEGE